MTDRSAKFASQQHRRGIGRAARTMEAVDFFNVLTGPELLETTEAYLPAHRERERVRALTRQTGELLSARAQRAGAGADGW